MRPTGHDDQEDLVTIDDLLPSWHDSDARRTIVDLLDDIDQVEPSRRVAVFDNDGTLWCERPAYPQLDFLVRELRRAMAVRPGLADRPEYRALLDGDAAAQAELGLVPIALALIEVFDGEAPAVFGRRVRDFFDTETHPSGRPYRAITYRPMIELLDALRAVGVTPFIVTGGGTEFVRAVSHDLYDIPPWHIVGTTVVHDVDDVDGLPVLHRTARVLGDANEGDVKVANIQLHLGTRPILAAGNSAGDARMLEHALGQDRDGVALLVDHDDAHREYAYESRAATFEATPVLETAAIRGWTVTSMRDDWTTVFG